MEEKVNIEKQQEGFAFAQQYIDEFMRNPYLKGVSKYYPHQGKKECARRMKQMGIVPTVVYTPK